MKGTSAASAAALAGRQLNLAATTDMASWREKKNKRNLLSL